MPDDFGPQSEQGLFSAAADGDADAARELGRLLFNEPGVTTSLIWSGTAPESEYWLRRAVAADPDDATALAWLAALLTRQYHMLADHALPPWQPRPPADLEQRRAAEHDWRAQLDRRRTEAMACCERALRLAPNQPTAVASLVVLLATTAWPDFGRRVRYVNPAAADDRTETRTVPTLIAAAELALDINPGNNLAAFVLARALEELGERERAVVWYQRALLSDPDDWEARERLTALAVTPVVPEIGVDASGFSFYLLVVSELAHASGDTNNESWLLNDADELRAVASRRVAEERFSLTDEETEFVRVDVFQRGRLAATIDLASALDSTSSHYAPATIDWEQVRVPPLHGTVLPSGHCVRIASEVLHFGHNLFAA